jgi:serine/threonine protein kinase
MPERIGRFKVLKELGKGSQGVVYLANDPQLDRNVAIKTIHLRPSRDSKEQQQVIIREARTVSKLQHPNIIAVYEAGESEDGPYVVFEYVDGVSLRNLVKGNGGLSVGQASKLMSQILEGIAYAHEQGVVHRDISPANILVSRNGIPRIMDFGVSIKTGGEGGMPRDISGTPCYMSPEHFSVRNMGPQSDIFSLGLVLYEMLTGKPAVRADNEFATMYKIANEPLPPPSSENPNIDGELDRIVLRAIAKDLNSRYGSASEMKRDLDNYLGPETIEEPKAEDSHVTLDFLLRRMKHKSDFPTFSQYIVEINQKASVRERNFTSASQLSNVIIKDLALTNKLLKLVNSAFYKTSGGQVTTVSRAVVILGFEQVRLAAASLMLFDHLQNKSQKAELQESAASSFMSGLIAKDLAERMRVRSTEEAFICAMLHRLGKHLVIFYFPEEYEQIKRLMAKKEIDENAACRAVLGISYDEIGSGVARAWKFPEKIIRSMQSAPRGRVERPTCEEDQLQVLSAFSNELCHIVSTAEGEEGGKAIASLMKRFDESIPVPKERVVDLLESAKEKMEDYSEILNIKPNKSRFLAKVESYSKAEKAEAEKEAAKKLEEKGPDTILYETLQVPDPVSAAKDEEDPDTILLNGIQEITNTLLEDYEINDIVTMILETMYRGFRFHHVLLCLLDKKRTNVAARFGFGENMDKIIEVFHFPVNPKSADIFNLALTQEKDLGIEDADDPRIRKGLPEWYLKTVSAPAFVLCPIVVNGAPVGLVYADRNVKGRVITGNQIKYMKTLCNQAVLAMKQLRRRS